MFFIFPVFNVSTGLCGTFDIFIADIRQFIGGQIKVITCCDKAVLIINSISFNGHISTGKNIGRRAVQINGSVLHDTMEIAPGIIIITG